MAVTRDGIPVRVWCWPGNTADSALIRQVKADMRDWGLGRVIWVADRGFTSEENRRYLQSGGGGYIIGEKLRSGSAEVKAALSRQGRYKTWPGTCKVKEVRIDDAGDRFIICFNPDAADRDAAIRGRTDRPARRDHRRIGRAGRDQAAELRGKISTMPGLNRFLRVTPGGLLRTDKARIKAEENLDGKYLLRSSDPKLSAEDIALGYKQLLEVERGWRDMKQVSTCARSTTGSKNASAPTSSCAGSRCSSSGSPRPPPAIPGPPSAGELERLHIGTFTGPAGTFRQRTELTKAQTGLLAKLAIPAPRQIIELQPAR